MSDEAPKQRFRLPREIRLLLSAGALVFIFEYLVIPQFATASHSIRLLKTVNPALVALAFLCEAAAIAAYAELTRTVFTPHAPHLSLIHISEPTRPY